MFVVEDVCDVQDLHATILQLLGPNHAKLTVRFGGRGFSLTDVYGRVIKEVIA